MAEGGLEHVEELEVSGVELDAKGDVAAVIKYACPTCGKLYARKDVVLRHLRVHTGEKFECNICGNTFYQKGDLERHNVQVHGPEGGFKCPAPECTKVYKSKSGLHYHSKVHKGQVSSCDRCDKTFSTAPALSQHYSSCHGDKSFDCSKCPKKFMSHTALLRHSRESCQIKSVAERQWKCSICGKDFVAKRYMTDHIKAHNKKQNSDHQCVICGKTYTKAASLVRHENTHSAVADERDKE